MSAGTSTPAPQLDAVLARRLAWSLGLSALAMYLVIVWPLFAGKVYVDNDLYRQFLPMRSFTAHSLAAGDAPYWWPNLFGGFYLHGEGQASLFHPFIWLIYRAFPVMVAFAIEQVIWYPVMFAGTYLLLRRRLGLDLVGALTGALLFAFAVFNLHRLVHPNALAITAHIPWMLILADVVFVSARSDRALWATLGFATLLASTILLGYPQYVFFAMLLVALWAVWRMVRKELRWVRLLWLGAATALGAAIAAVQLLPTQAALASSVRGQPGMWSAEGPFEGSTRPEQLLTAFSPFTLPVSHKQRIYAGVVPLALGVLAFWRWKKTGERRALVMGLGLLALLSVILAMGKYGYLYSLQTKLPFVNKFRYPSRYFLFTQLALAFLSALVVMDLVRERPLVKRWRDLWPLGVIILLAVATTLMQVVRHGEMMSKAPALVLAGGATVVLGVVLVMLAARGKTWALLLLPPLFALDATGYGTLYHETGKPAELMVAEPQPPRLTDERVAAGRADALTLLGWHVLDGVAGLDPVKQLDYRKLPALRVAGVGWVVPDPIDSTGRFYETYETKDLVPQLQEAVPGVYRIADPMPRARLVAAAQVSDHPGKDVETIDVARVALVDRPLELGGSPGQVTIASDRPGAIAIDTVSDGPQLLVVTESFDRGWTARVDEALAQPLPAYGDLLSVIVPQGQHRVRFDYVPPALARGKRVSLMALAALGLLTLAASGLTLRHRQRLKRSA